MNADIRTCIFLAHGRALCLEQLLPAAEEDGILLRGPMKVMWFRQAAFFTHYASIALYPWPTERLSVTSLKGWRLP